MSVQVRPGCYCERCQRPVAAQKRSHRIRNTAAAITAVPTAGASLFAARRGQWHCPGCGGPVRDEDEGEVLDVLDLDTRYPWAKWAFAAVMFVFYLANTL